jgi:hypothetical protein
MTTLTTLQAELAHIEALIAEQRKVAKIEKKLVACKLTQRTAHKYYDLQAAYMAAIK